METQNKRIAAVVGALSLAATLVVKEEGWRNDPYRDVGGIWTACAGDTKGVKPGVRVSDRECRQRLVSRLAEHGDGIYDCLRPDTPVSVRAAFTSFAYNVGVNAACGSTPFRLAREQRYPQACDALRMWNKAGGRVVRGLVKRREDERALCLSGIGPNGLV